MKWALLFFFLLFFGLAWMLIDIQMTSQTGKIFDDFTKLSKLYTLQIEKNDFVYRKIDE